MKTENILLIAGACLAGYFLWKQYNGEGLDWFGGGGGGGGLGETGNDGPLIPSPPSGGGGYRGYTNTGQGSAPASYEVTTVLPMTTKVQMTGGRLNTFQSVPGSTRAALITVGTPTQQIQQFNTAPKIVVINGKATKVM
jgi:hypothetical protein